DRLCAHARRAVGVGPHLRLADVQPLAQLREGVRGVAGMGRGNAFRGDRHPVLQLQRVGQLREGVRGLQVRPEVPRPDTRRRDMQRLLRRFRPGGGVMADQSWMWPPVPNGLPPNGRGRRVSVFLTPRLNPAASPGKLASFFPDWEDWPATLRQATFDVSYGA